MNASLSDIESAALLKLARATLEWAVRHLREPGFEELGISLPPGAGQVMGGFVTLYRDRVLRGCIGEIQPTRSIGRVVKAQTVNAALHDTRFEPVRPEETASLRIEISALSPPRAVASAEEIKIGLHGILLHAKGRHAVFLPQVAPEQGWNRDQTLTHLALKAGLPPDAWRSSAAEFEVFEACVFGETQG